MSDWNEPDPETLTELTRWGSFGADGAVINASGAVSAIRAPDGSAQRLTGAELTVVGVRAALRLLLANGLIEPRLPEGEFMVQLDPPAAALDAQ